jgi:hypothetical protein
MEIYTKEEVLEIVKQMEIYTKEEVLEIVKQIVKQIAKQSADLSCDEYGQVTIYSDIWKWSDGTYRDEREPDICYACEEDKDCQEHGRLI